MSDINFSKLTWENLPARTTALSATNLNRIENGIADSVNGVNSNSHSIAELQTRISQIANGSPTPVATVAEMTDESAVYLYTGSETGYTAGNWYYYDGSAWTSGGTYGGAATDTTLSISGSAADAKAVGDALADKADAADVTALDTRVTAVEGDVDDLKEDLNDISDVIYIQPQNIYNPDLQTSETISPHYYVNGYPYSTTQFDSQWNCTAEIEVEPNTTYTVALVPDSNGENKPWGTAGSGGFLYDENHNYIPASTFKTNTFTTGPTAKYLRFNYMLYSGKSLSTLNAACMIVKGNTVPNDYVAYGATIKDNVDKNTLDIADIKSTVSGEKYIPRVRCIVDSLGTSVTVISKYTDEEDIAVKIGVGGGNGLVDFRELATIANTSAELSKNTDNAIIFLNANDADWCAPIIVSADNNADGDHPTNKYFTGGNHRYNNTSKPMDSTNPMTARVANIHFYIDHREITSGDNEVGHFAEIRWDNYVQAYNTTKADGTGREVLKEEHLLTFNGEKWESYVSIVPLEDVTVETWYGFQFTGFQFVWPNVRFIGATNRGVYSPTSSQSYLCGDSSCLACLAYGTEHSLNLRIDGEYDLGDRSGIGTRPSIFTSGYKGYTNMAYNLPMASGDMYSAHGTYIFKAVI